MRGGICFFLSATLLSGVVGLQGPMFLHEPPALIRFANSTGVVLSCSGHGHPPPRLRWVDSADHEVTLVPGFRNMIGNGSLYLQPFPGEMLRPEIHATTYHCLLSNTVGAVLSRAIWVQAVVTSDYQVEVVDAHTLLGNVAVLRCEASDAVRDVVRVEGWTQDNLLHHRVTIHSGGRYTLAGQWTLHVSDVTREDSTSLFYCHTVHLLTGERRFSSPGRIIITKPEDNIPPTITDTSQLVTGIAGTSADVACQAQGYPPPSIRWFRDAAGRLEELAHITSRSVLTLPLLQPQHAGRYVCIARNIVGEDRREIMLRVLTELAAFVRPQQQVVDAGAVATFNCTVNGGQCSDLRATWRKNGRIMSQDRRISITPLGDSMVIRGVRRSDAGMYQCFVSCSEESAQGTGELILGAVAPEILSSWLERTLEPGPPISLRCVVSGNPPPRVTWLLDGGDLRPQGYTHGSFIDNSGAVVSHLNVSSIRVQHGGVYTCLARNLLGTAQHSAALNVYGSPSPRPALNLTVVAATDVLLRCPVAGYPVTVSWSRGNEGLSPGPHHVVLHNGTLLVRQIDGARDAGSYSCTATSDMGLSAQGKIYLEVMKPPKIAQFQFPSDLEEGMRAQVACSLVSGDLPISITWRKDGGPLPQDPTVQEQQLQFVSNLLFGDLAARHTGDYTCIASNAAAVANATAKLLVRVAPSWEVQPRDTAVLFQETGIIHCRAYGYPQPILVWLTPSGEPVDSMDPTLHVLSNGTLLVRSATRDREGQYTCQVSNGIGTGLTKSIFLRVNMPARFRSKVQTQSGIAGESVVLSCTVEGDSPLHITWDAKHRLLQPLYPQIRERHTPSGLVSELHLENLNRRDEGSFRCRGSNEFGHDDAVIRLVVKEAPATPRPPLLNEVRSRSLGVTWSLEPDTNVLIQYKSVDSPAWSNLSVPTGLQTARVIMLQPGTKYLVRLIAINEVGASSPSLATKASTLQEAPQRAPTELSAKGAASDSLSVRWNPTDSDTGGPVLGYVVSYAVEGASAGDMMHRRLGGSLRSSVILKRLRTFTRYSIAVAAFNHIGMGPFSAIIVAATLQGVPDKPPEEVRCAALSPQALRVQWNLPPASQHRGIIDGYKVFYAAKGMAVGIKSTSNRETTLHGLSKATNYTITVLAFTAAGDGVKSGALHCLTHEDIPGPPVLVKALPMTSDSIVVAWTPPNEPNGNILNYNIYVHPLKPGAQVTSEKILADGELIYEARRLHEMTRYEFWVSATTFVGEGRISIKLTQSPLSKVPARVAGWSRHISAGAGDRLVLTCRHVGLPAPSRLWRGPGGSLLPAAQPKIHRLLPDGSLVIYPIRSRDAGNYTCLVENVFGRDEITYHVTVLSMPGIPVVRAKPLGQYSLSVEWDAVPDGGNTVTSYILSWRMPGADWQQVEVWDGLVHTLTGLHCGHEYQITVAAVNDVGRGRASNVITANTSGTVPGVPTLEEFILVNMTSVTLLLEDWPDGGCPLQNFAVEISRLSQSSWKSEISTSPYGELDLPGLLPGTWYMVRVTVVNEAGSFQHIFNFATRNLDGGIPPAETAQGAAEGEDSVYGSVFIIVPIFSAILCTFAVVICICIFVRRWGEPPCKIEEQSYRTSGSCEKLDSHLGQLPPPPSNCKAHGMRREHKNSVSSGHDYEICPYATFNLADAGQQNSSRDYSMHLRSFNQQECFQAAPNEAIELIGLRSSKSPPDGLSVEVSCISSQQTLPMRTFNRTRGRRGGDLKESRPWSCPTRKDDSDSSDRSTTPAQSPVEKHTGWRTPRKLLRAHNHYTATVS